MKKRAKINLTDRSPKLGKFSPIQYWEILKIIHPVILESRSDLAENVVKNIISKILTKLTIFKNMQCIFFYQQKIRSYPSS